MRFRAPASWTIDTDPARRGEAATTARRVVVEVLQLESPAAAGPQAVVAALQGLPAQGERSVEVLPNGHVLMKTVEAVGDRQGLRASYTWHLARAVPGRRLQVAVFRLQLPVAAAGEVFAQADLATLDREVRDATFA
jgi:hypothetical protein